MSSPRLSVVGLVSVVPYTTASWFPPRYTPAHNSPFSLLRLGCFFFNSVFCELPWLGPVNFSFRSSPRLNVVGLVSVVFYATALWFIPRYTLAHNSPILHRNTTYQNSVVTRKLTTSLLLVRFGPASNFFSSVFS